MKAIERISIYLEFKMITPHKFEHTLHISNGYFNKQYKKKGSIGSDILIKVAEKYEDLNMLWILTGEGIMLKYPAKIIEILESKQYIYNKLKLLNQD